MKMTIQNTKTQLMLLVAIIGICFSVMPGISLAAIAPATCTFTRDLQIGVTGDDVKCLQKYLNTKGFPIAATGVGSKGHETGEYKALTEAAVIKWQKANKLVPAIGYFGAQSRLLFKNGSLANTAGTAAVNAPLINVPNSTAAASDSPLAAQVAALKAQLEAIASTQPGSQSNPVTPVPLTTATPLPATSAVVVAAAPNTVSDAQVRTQMSSVLSLVAKAEKAIKKNSSGSSMTSATDSLTLAKNEVIKSLIDYLAGKLTDTSDTLVLAKKDANKALTLATAVSEKMDAKKALTDIQSNYSDAKDKVTQADDDGKIVTAAQKLLKKAANVIDDAVTAYDDEGYKDVLDLTDEADGLVNDAIDAIGNRS